MSKNVVISAYVSEEVAKIIQHMADQEDRTKSYVAGRILAAQVKTSPIPIAKFSRRHRTKKEAA